MKRRRTSDVHIFFPQKLLDEIDDEVDMDRFPSRSHGILYYVQMGKQLDVVKDRCKDPAVRDIIDKNWDKFKIEDSMKKMELEDIEYIGKALQMIKDEKINELIT